MRSRLIMQEAADKISKHMYTYCIYIKKLVGLSIMASQVVRWGNSLGVRIPASIAKQAHLEEGTAISVTVVGDSIVIRSRRTKYTLDDLLEGMTTDNVHCEIDMGIPVGNELW